MFFSIERGKGGWFPTVAASEDAQLLWLPFSFEAYVFYFLLHSILGFAGDKCRARAQSSCNLLSTVFCCSGLGKVKNLVACSLGVRRVIN